MNKEINTPNKFYNEATTPKIVQLVTKLSGGAIKEQKQAEWILFWFVVVAICISLCLVFEGIFENPKPKTDRNSFPGIVHNLK
jgi:hypothetical protein